MVSRVGVPALALLLRLLVSRDTDTSLTFLSTSNPPGDFFTQGLEPRTSLPRGTPASPLLISSHFEQSNVHADVFDAAD